MCKIKTMAKKVRKIDPYKLPKRVCLGLSAVIHIYAFFKRLFEGAKIIKCNRIPKPPYLLISSHMSWMDFYEAIGANKWHQPYWVATIEEFANKNGLMRAFGIFPKRRYDRDTRSVSAMMDVLKKKKKILVMYPEAGFSFVGQPQRIEKGLGKFAKMCDVPIVLLNCHGNYLRKPFWSDMKTRRVRPMIAEMRTIVSRDQVRMNSAEDIQAKILKEFNFDDEQWQIDNNILIKYKNRAVGLHRILYKCPHCGQEFEMSSEGVILKCNHCGTIYEYSDNGLLKCLNGKTKFERISKWFKWEKEEVEKEVRKGAYHFEANVRVEHLAGVGTGFVVQPGEYHLEHSIKNGIVVTGGDGFKYERPPLQNPSIHIEYDWKHRGACLDLANNNNTWFVYLLENPTAVTKIRFAVESIYNYQFDKMNNNKE